MKKRVILASLSAMLLPVALMAVCARLGLFEGEEAPPREPVRQTQPEEPAQTLTGDARTQVPLRTADGQDQTLPMDEYLTGVILSEMPVEFHEEALKAQAVVARTYTCKHMQRQKHDVSAVCTDPGCCQGFRSVEAYLLDGGSQAGVDRVRQAVAATDAMVLTYDGDLIDATYFSCSGGTTEDAVAVWGQDVPYLQAVDSPGEEDAPRYTERLTFTAEEFRTLTDCAGQGDPAQWFGEISYTDGNGVDTVQICGEAYTGVRLREALGLRSTAFSIQVEDGDIIIETKGFGHRVGMSQYGAQAMADEGKTWEQILIHYYQGAEIEAMEEN